MNIINFILIVFLYNEIRDIYTVNGTVKDKKEETKEPEKSKLVSKFMKAFSLEPLYDDDDEYDDDDDDIGTLLIDNTLRINGTEKNTTSDPPKITEGNTSKPKETMYLLNSPEKLIEYLTDRYYSGKSLRIYDKLTMADKTVLNIDNNGNQLYINFTDNTVSYFSNNRFYGFKNIP